MSKKYISLENLSAYNEQVKARYVPKTALSEYVKTSDIEEVTAAEIEALFADESVESV